MLHRIPATVLVAASFVVSLAFLSTSLATAQTETALYNFSGVNTDPVSNVLFDPAGNLYGGSNSGGVWELTPQPDGTWTAKTLGAVLYPDGLVFDSTGDLYVTAIYGRARGQRSDGAIFELLPSASGNWTLKSIHSFSGTDGQYPDGPLVFDSSGNLFGVTMMGGAYGQGVVFELTREPNGYWKQTILHAFGNAVDGAEPFAGLILDNKGNLYGTTSVGGANGDGTVFELVRGKTGMWPEKILHSFDGSDGGGPYSGLIFDTVGNLYGTTAGGGAYGFGTAFELTPQSGGGWTHKVLHDFGNGTDGIEPQTGLIFDNAGNLYGTTSEGGADNCQDYYAGNVFELSPSASGQWNETVLANFCDETGGGGVNSLIFGAHGNLFGTTYAGGTDDGGIAFEITR
jgi:uncharacterized repeat protein (TIGR03803 family)